jgi:ribosomal protein S27E
MSAVAHALPAPRRRRVLAHQCRQCRQHWAMQAVHHPSGTAVLCRHCGYLARPPLAVVTADGELATT